MMSAAEIEKGMESLQGMLERREEDIEFNLKRIEKVIAKMRAGDKRYSSCELLAYANKVRDIETEVETIEAKLRLCKEILGE